TRHHEIAYNRVRQIMIAPLQRGLPVGCSQGVIAPAFQQCSQTITSSGIFIYDKNLREEASHNQFTSRDSIKCLLLGTVYASTSNANAKVFHPRLGNFVAFQVRLEG